MKKLNILLFAFFIVINIDAQNLLVSYKIKDINIMSVDKEKNILLGGMSGSTIDLDFGPGVHNLNSPYGESTQFIARYDSLLNFKWARSFIGGISDSPGKILTDDSGNVYVGGFAYDSTIFDISSNAMYSAPFAGTYDSFLAKYNKNGEFQWVKNIDGKLIGLSGNSLFTDDFLTINKYDLNGENIWKTNVPIHRKIVFDQNSLFYLLNDNGGEFQSKPLSLSAIDTSGIVQPTLILTSGVNSLFDFNRGNLFYINGKLLISAPYWGEIDLDLSVNNHMIKNSSTYAYYERGYYMGQRPSFKNFIAEYDTKGNFIFAKDYQDNIAIPYKIQTDNWGNIYTVTSFSDSINLSYIDKDARKITSKGLASCITKYDSSFNFIATVRLTEIDKNQANNYNSKISALYLGKDYSIMMGGYYNLFLKQNVSLYPNTPENYIAIYKNLEISSMNTTHMKSSIVSVYPNPVHNNFTIEIPQTGKPAILTIYNTKGSEMLRKQINGSKTTIDISNFTSDIYFVKLQTGCSINVLKIIKK